MNRSNDTCVIAIKLAAKENSHTDTML